MAQIKNHTIIGSYNEPKGSTRLNIENWIERYCHEIKNLTPDEIKLLESYRPIVQKGIQMAINGTYLYELFDIDETIECYVYEIMIKLKADILNQKTKKNIFYRTKKLATIRRYTWLRRLDNQKETLQVYNENQHIVTNTDGSFIDAEIPQNDFELSVNPSAIHHINPENYLKRKQLNKIIQNLPQIIGSLDIKRAHLFKEILQMQLSGTDVVGKHRIKLGLQSDKQVREFKCQAFKLAQEIMTEIVPELKEYQYSYRKQYGRKWKIIKTTFNERKEFFKKQTAKEMGPVTIRIWHIYKGREKNSKQAS
ncbi:uncharacterized protein Dvar_51470 [Desulfosarcina variabilis str. Montpellier]|uniref:hypothetical protein n=1 Tax=Desulfosarcina variabilis TaxID=2300 RepID=UPI003AFB20D7